MAVMRKARNCTTGEQGKYSYEFSDNVFDFDSEVGGREFIYLLINDMIEHKLVLFKS